MSVIVTDTGFAADQWTDGFQAWDDTNLTRSHREGGYELDVSEPASPGHTAAVCEACAMIRCAFPSAADGRGFTLARHLRRLGYTGRLRAHGHVLADQYAMARRCGFDEVEISNDMAARQPHDQWLFRANWQEHGYLNRLQQPA